MKWLNAQSYCIKIFFTTLLDNSAPLFHFLGHSIYSSNPFAAFLLTHSLTLFLAPFTLHLVPFDPILCFFFWSRFKVWSARSHLITNKFVWLFHCFHLAFIQTQAHTHTQQAFAMLRASKSSAKPRQWDNILISRHDYVVFCVCMCLACSGCVCDVLYLPKSWRKFALYVQRNNSLPKLGLKRQTTGSIPLCKYTLYTTKRLWAYLITSFT